MSESSQSAFVQAQQEVNATLQAYLSPAQPQLLWEAMAYSVLGGGKRLRPLLCLFACQAVSGTWQPALKAAAAVEMIHAYSLIHDDLPALDNDDWRRGKPSNHRQYGEDIAILAGDALLTYAFQILSEPDAVPAQTQVRVMAELAQAAGPAGMCAGQTLDLRAAELVSSEAQILEVYRLKTGALIRAAVRMGALLGQASELQLQALSEYAEQLGQAFQLVDDLLDLSGSFEALGKTPGKDLAQQKKTYPALMGEAQTSQRVDACLAQALAALDRTEWHGQQALITLAHGLVKRQA